MCAVRPWLNIITLKKTTAQGPKNILQIRKDDLIFSKCSTYCIASSSRMKKWQYLYSSSKTVAALSLALCIWSNIVVVRTSEKWSTPLHWNVKYPLHFSHWRTFRKTNGNAGTNLVKYLRHCHQATPAPALCQPGQSSWFSHKQCDQLVVRAYCAIVGTCHPSLVNAMQWRSVSVVLVDLTTFNLCDESFDKG